MTSPIGRDETNKLGLRLSTDDTCVVSGADGFVGAALCNHLENLGGTVIRVVRTPRRPSDIVVDFSRGTAIDLRGMSPRYVFHLAARVHQSDERQPRLQESVTVGGTETLLEAAVEAGSTAFVFFSSCAVMRQGVPHPIDESEEPAPTSAYGRAKLVAERLVISANGQNGVRTCSLRLPLVYGPGHKGALPRMVAAIQSGWFPPLPRYKARRSVVHIQDVCKAAVVVATDPRAAGQIYVVAEPRSYSSRELYEIVLAGLGRRPPDWRMPHIGLEIAARVADLAELLTRRKFAFDTEVLRRLSEPAEFRAERIERDLGFRPERTLADALPELVGRTLAH